MVVHRIARRLNDLGIPTKHGCKWESRTVRSKLIDESYTGVGWYGKKRHRRINGKRVETDQPRSEWVKIEGFFPRLIEPAIFERVQNMWGSQQSAKRVHRREYPFTGVMFCGECESTMAGATQKKKFPYYRCSGTVPNAKRDACCNTPGIPADS